MGSTARNPLAKRGLARGDAAVFEAYKLGSKDCMGFAMQIASLLKNVGLTVPPRGATNFL